MLLINRKSIPTKTSFSFKYFKCFTTITQGMSMLDAVKNIGKSSCGLVDLRAIFRMTQ